MITLLNRLQTIEVSSSLLVLLVSSFIAAVSNHVLISSLVQRLDIFSTAGFGYILALFALMIAVLAVGLLLLGVGFLLKTLLVLSLFLSAAISYFNQQYGVIFDTDMIRNIVETVRDKNVNEGVELISTPFIQHILLYALLPAMFVILVKVRHRKVWFEMLQRLAYALGLAIVVAALIMFNYKYVSFFSRENRDLRVWVTPIFPILSACGFFRDESRGDDIPFRQIGMDAVQQKTTVRRRVGIMVVGETARADHFSLNGYKKNTNAFIKGESLVNLTQARSCGTSTAYSVPCMFSFLERNEYSPGKAGKQSNVLDVLKKAKINTVWIDNNSSCKGVCKRIEMLDIYIADNHRTGRKGFFDEKLLQVMRPYIEKSNDDTLVVLHIMGSHGPAYHKRFPKEFARFTPYCQSNAPQECSNDELSNAYDNTILYTDYILSQLITYLKQNNDQYDSFMMYASDHGESLGENGLYLHGLPYFLAPDSQTHIPMLVWFSDAFKQSRETAIEEDVPYSHDNISHTLLGLFDVKSSVYKPQLDLFSGVVVQ